ncbi:Crp/Fnr family transcriptional regulator [Marivirga sp. S37H4]|uniref:Crp/Fnr family transcriptional regulator n=1 Tax=Marivirga aurantiaca TaxID=2802615 RepID=A0A934WW00_9BACT|nr:Crp/Fnr family transcriptional regulator [Marivirga aurantiaca]MBK6263989.1 Crp/Fnr family transcriptional regulator [Marivirga aurantiaca]
MPNRGIKISCEECTTFNCFVKQASPEWLAKISQFKNQVVYPKGQYIFTEGSPVFGAYFILSGQVKVVSSVFSGKQNIVRLASDGHMVGHKGIGHETYNIGAVALQDSRICFVSNELLYDAFLNNPHFTIEVMMFYSKELRKSETRSKYFAQMTTEEKVAYAILYTYETLQDHDEDGLPCIFLSRQELAELAGTNAEQVSRSITTFKNDGLISPEGRCVKILQLKGFHQLLSPYDQFI